SQTSLHSSNSICQSRISPTVNGERSMARSRTANAFGPAIVFNGLTWVPMHPGVSFDMLGFIPSFLSASDERPAREQIAASNISGWNPFNTNRTKGGFSLLEDGSGDLQYPGDPRTRCLYMTKLREEYIYFYQHAWLRISQPDGTWEVARLD